MTSQATTRRTPRGSLRPPAARLLRLALAALPLAACARAGAVRAPAEDHGAFVVTLGADTVALERFTRSATRLEGDLLVRQPTTMLVHYVTMLGANGMPTRLEYAARRPDGSPIAGQPRSVALTFGPDTVVREVTRDTVARQRLAAPGAFPSLPNSFAHWELVLAHMRATGRDSASVQVLGATAPRAQTWPVRLLSGDSARIWYFGDPQRVHTDARGRILGLDARATTNKVVVQRLAALDVEGLGRSFAAREAQGMGYGVNVRDTVRATIGGAQVSVNYWRPLRRGRQIFGPGGLVPPDTVWRTGANDATQLATTATIELGGATVPAGTYTLWTIPGRGTGDWRLVVNRQFGQWGTEYHADRDLARVPLGVEQVGAPAERFTIAIESGEGGRGTLVMTWDRTRLTAPIVVR
jgi:hypothetical protein